MKLTYYCEITESKDDDCFYVSFPDLPGGECQTYADTYNEALKMAGEYLALLVPDIPVKPIYQQGIPIELDEKMSFVQWLKWERTKQGMTQKEIAQKIGISSKNYQRLENPARFNPNFTTLLKVREALGLKELIF